MSTTANSAVKYGVMLLDRFKKDIFDDILELMFYFIQLLSRHSPQYRSHVRSHMSITLNSHEMLCYLGQYLGTFPLMVALYDCRLSLSVFSAA